MNHLYEELLELRDFYKRGGNTISNSLNIQLAEQQLKEGKLPTKEILEALVKLTLVENLTDVLKKGAQ
jgi:hypothetical protein